jgi:putative endonuclease
MYYVYILENAEGKHYIGHTEDLVSRLKRHNAGQVRATKNKGSWKIVYNEDFKSRIEASDREKQIKSYKGGEAFKKLLV